MMTRMIGASSELVIHGEDGSLIPPAELEEFSKQVMEALLEQESRPRARIHSPAVSATLAEGRMSIEFCINAVTFDEAQRVFAKTLRSIIEDRLGHRLVDDDAQETSRELELVGV
jgi:hypothetical protein